ncbi:MAG: hypothetical protein KC561_15195, partial [Myxococcales bacterium]|nr:hypothetical protein [Myxococcales bacterium]
SAAAGVLADYIEFVTSVVTPSELIAWGQALRAAGVEDDRYSAELERALLELGAVEYALQWAESAQGSSASNGAEMLLALLGGRQARSVASWIETLPQSERGRLLWQTLETSAALVGAEVTSEGLRRLALENPNLAELSAAWRLSLGDPYAIPELLSTGPGSEQSIRYLALMGLEEAATELTSTSSELFSMLHRFTSEGDLSGLSATLRSVDVPTRIRLLAELARNGHDEMFASSLAALDGLRGPELDAAVSFMADQPGIGSEALSAIERFYLGRGQEPFQSAEFSRLMAAADQPQQVAPALERAVRAFPGSSGGWLAFSSYLNHGQPRRAAELLADGLVSGDLATLSDAALDLGPAEDRLVLLNDLCARFPGDLGLETHRIRALLESGDEAASSAALRLLDVVQNQPALHARAFSVLADESPGLAVEWVQNPVHPDQMTDSGLAAAADILVSTGSPSDLQVAVELERRRLTMPTMTRSTDESAARLLTWSLPREALDVLDGYPSNSILGWAVQAAANHDLGTSAESEPSPVQWLRLERLPEAVSMLSHRGLREELGILFTRAAQVVTFDSEWTPALGGLDSALSQLLVEEEPELAADILVDELPSVRAFPLSLGDSDAFVHILGATGDND